MLGQPDVLIDMITSYLPDPNCHFNLKSTCNYFHKILSHEYTFSSLSHLLWFSEDSCNHHSFRAYNIRWGGEMDIVTLRFMLRYEISPSLIIPFVAGSSVDGLMEDMVVDALLADFLFYHATVTGHLEFSYKVLERRLLRHPAVPLSINPIEATNVCRKVALFGTEYQIIFLFTFFGDMFTQSHAEDIVNTVVIRGFLFCISFLHTLGVNFNRSRHGLFPLQAAVQSGKREVLDLLLRMKTKTRLRYRHGQHSPLHLACMLKDANMVEQLLGHGASASERDFLGYTPLNVVNRMIHTESKLKPRESRMNDLIRIQKILVSRK